MLYPPPAPLPVAPALEKATTRPATSSAAGKDRSLITACAIAAFWRPTLSPPPIQLASVPVSQNGPCARERARARERAFFFAVFEFAAAEKFVRRARKLLDLPALIDRLHSSRSRSVV